MRTIATVLVEPQETIKLPEIPSSWIQAPAIGLAIAVLVWLRNAPNRWFDTRDKKIAAEAAAAQARLDYERQRDERSAAVLSEASASMKAFLDRTVDNQAAHIQVEQQQAESLGHVASFCRHALRNRKIVEQLEEEMAPKATR